MIIETWSVFGIGRWGEIGRYVTSIRAENKEDALTFARHYWVNVCVEREIPRCPHCGEFVPCDCSIIERNGDGRFVLL